MENLTGQIPEAMSERQLKVQEYQKKKKSVTNLLTSYQAQIQAALPTFIKPQTAIQAAITCMMKKPELMDCTSHSLIACVLTASQMGLVFDDFLGEAYLIPFNNTKKGVREAQFVPGYKGLCKLARNSGLVKSIKAVPVYEGDHFIHEEGLNDRLEHKPMGNENPAEITHVYAIIKYLNGGYEFIVMTRSKIEGVRDKSKNYINAKNKAETVWVKDFEEMAKKTTVRRLLKLAPLSPEVARAVALDEAADMGMQNVAADWANDLPTMTEEIEHEMVEENVTNQKEAEESRQQNNQANASAKAGVAASATEAAMKKNQKINPK